MTISALEYVFLSDAAYAPDTGADANATMTSLSNGRVNGDDFERLEGNRTYTVFKKKSTGEVVITIKGTDFYSPNDLAADLYIAFNRLERLPRFRDLMRVVDRYKVQSLDVSVTGHSLGGALAALVAQQSEILGVAFNMGSSPVGDIMGEWATDGEKERIKEHVIHFTTTYDIVSTTAAFTSTAKTFHIKGGLDPIKNHKMSVFYNIDGSAYDSTINSYTDSIRAVRKSKTSTDQYATKKRHMSDGDTLGQSVIDGVENVADLLILGVTMKAVQIALRTFLQTQSIPGVVRGAADSVRGAASQRLAGINEAARGLQGALRRMTDAFRQARAAWRGGGAQFDNLADNSQFMDDVLGDIEGEFEFAGVSPEELFQPEELLPVEDVGGGIMQRMRQLMRRAVGDDPQFDPVRLDLGDDSFEGLINGPGQGRFINEDIENDELKDVLDGDGGGADAEGVGGEMEGFGGGEARLPGADQEGGLDFDLDADELVIDGGVDIEAGELGAEEAGFEMVRLADMEASEMILGAISVAGIGAVVVATIILIAMPFIAMAQRAQKSRELKGKIDAQNQAFDARLQAYAMKAKVPIPPERPRSGQYTWSSADTFGGGVMVYLKWRADHPEVLYAGSENELTVFAKLYQKYVGPGIPLVYVPDGSEANRMASELNKKPENVPPVGKIMYQKHMNSEGNFPESFNFSNGWDEFAYCVVYDLFAKYNGDVGRKGYKENMKAFVKAHKYHKYDDMDNKDRFNWLTRLREKLSPEMGDYVNGVFSLPEFISSLDTTNAGENTVQRAMYALRKYIITIITSNPSNADKNLRVFEKTHGMPVIHKGIEQALVVRNMMVWLQNTGHDMEHFQTYISLGTTKILTDPPRSIAEQQNANRILADKMARDNIDFIQFYNEGGKPKGDRETNQEFTDRFNRWRKGKALEMTLDSHRPLTTEEEYKKRLKEDMDYIKNRNTQGGGGAAQSVDPGTTYIGGDGATVCQFKPRKKQKQDIPYADAKHRRLGQSTTTSKAPPRKLQPVPGSYKPSAGGLYATF